MRPRRQTTTTTERGELISTGTYCPRNPVRRGNLKGIVPRSGRDNVKVLWRRGCCQRSAESRNSALQGKKRRPIPDLRRVESAKASSACRVVHPACRRLICNRRGPGKGQRPVLRG